MGVILLVRHGQASFGAGDYDRLSPMGIEQARIVGGALAARGFRPGHVVAGSMRRQSDTAEALVEAAGWGVRTDLDQRWNEFDHARLISDHAQDEQPTDPRRFQELLDTVMTTWAAAREPSSGETFADFTVRASSALRRITDVAHGGDALVVSSGGVISWLTAALLGGGPEQWVRLNRVCVNTGVTKLVVGRSGSSLVTFNEHSHLPADRVTYR